MYKIHKPIYGMRALDWIYKEERKKAKGPNRPHQKNDKRDKRKKKRKGPLFKCLVVLALEH